MCEHMLACSYINVYIYLSVFTTPDDWVITQKLIGIQIVNSFVPGVL